MNLERRHYHMRIRLSGKRTHSLLDSREWVEICNMDEDEKSIQESHEDIRSPRISLQEESVLLCLVLPPLGRDTLTILPRFLCDYLRGRVTLTGRHEVAVVDPANPAAAATVTLSIVCVPLRAHVVVNDELPPIVTPDVAVALGAVIRFACFVPADAALRPLRTIVDEARVPLPA